MMTAVMRAGIAAQQDKAKSQERRAKPRRGKQRGDQKEDRSLASLPLAAQTRNRAALVVVGSDGGGTSCLAAPTEKRRGVVWWYSQKGTWA